MCIYKEAGEAMARIISIGNQGFDTIREKNCSWASCGAW